MLLMVAIIENKLEELKRLCQEYSVARLELFGSATDDTFDPENSDLDFLVDFDRSPKMNAFHQYFGFLIALEELYSRSIDLVDAKSMRNPYFMESVNESRKLVYAA